MCGSGPVSESAVGDFLPTPIALRGNLVLLGQVRRPGFQP